MTERNHQKGKGTPAVPEIMTATETADYLRLDIGTTKSQLRLGIIPGRKIGRQWRVSRSAVNALLQGAGREIRA